MKSNQITLNWRNLLFFAAIHVTAVIAVPIYICKVGIRSSDIALFMFWAVATGMAITVGYHRLFAHRTFKTRPFIVFLSLFFGAAAFEESALQWTSQHGDHHKYVDTEKDPYNIKQGFWYAHIGWILFRNHAICYDNVKDLSQSKVISHQYKYYILWSSVTGIILPVLMGVLFGNLLGGFLFGVLARITFVHHGTFFINSVCHYFGRPNYDVKCSAKDHWFVALMTHGEGYHSFHHRFPSDYRNGYKWYHWDPSKWFIAACSWVGLTSDLKRVSKFTILAARLAAEKESVEVYFAKQPHSAQAAALNVLKEQYEHLKEILHKWEQNAREHAALYSQLQNKSDILLRSALERAQAARKQFLNVREQWIRYIQKPALVSIALNPS